MKLQFQFRGLNANHQLRARLGQELEQLHLLIPVSTAEVVLEHKPEATPGIRACVHLAVPGPDIHAVAVDHTVQAAWLKVVKRLARKIERRKNQQHVRRKLQHPRALRSCRWSASTSGACI